MKLTKKRLIIFISLFLLFLALTISLIFYGFRPTSKSDDVVTFEIKEGLGKREIVNALKRENIIKSKYSIYLYLIFHPKLNLQAGNYLINRFNPSIDIINDIAKGKIDYSDKLITLTFKEGITIKDIAEIISENFDFTTDEVMEKLKSEKYAEELVHKYDFLTPEILNNQIYYPLEGYLYPDTYEFYKNSTLSDIIEKLLKETGKKLSKIKNIIDESGYTTHEILTIASIAEKEAKNTSDRSKVAQVIYSRLDKEMTLGMDVTTYYGVGKDLSEDLTQKDLNSINGYNTREKNFLHLPVGPICNTSIDTINAILNPSDTKYLYFFADLETGEVTFFEEYNEFNKFKNNQYSRIGDR